MDLRDKLFYEWNIGDLLVEGLRGDGTLYRAPTMEEYAAHPERYLEGSELVPHSLKITGYTMENVSSGVPVLLSAADYEMAARAFIDHGGSVEEFM